MKRILTSMFFGLALTVCNTAAHADTQKWPYLLYPGVNTQMEVIWQDTATETDTICWSTDASYSNCAPSTENNVTEYAGGAFTSVHQHTFTITGLTPETKYYYQVSAPDNTHPDVHGVCNTNASGNCIFGSGSFITAPPVGQTHVRFIGQGDSRSNPYFLDSLDQAISTMTSQPGNSEYQRLSIANGDWVSTDGELYWNQQWFLPQAQEIINYTANTPLDGCKGNHDNASGFSATFPKYYPYPYPTALGALTVKTTTTNQYCGGTVTKPNASDANGTCIDGSGNPYYNNLFWSFDYGPVHFTVIDEYSSMAAGSVQYNWVLSDLAAANANPNTPWKIIIYHEPAYSAGSDGDNTSVRIFEPFVTTYGVDLIFSGHSHNYARAGVYNSAQAGNDLIAPNVPHITSGGGGAPIYQTDLTNKGSYPHVITAWPALEFMTFDVNGKTLTMTSYQVNNAKSATPTPWVTPSGLTISQIEQVVLNHFTNVSNQVTAQVGNIVYNRATKTYNGTVTITNTGTTPLIGNVDVVLDGMLYLQGIGTPDNEYSTKSPKDTTMIAANAAGGPTPGTGLITNVTLKNATGSNNGEPMIQATTNGLAAGASITVPLQFSNPNNVPIVFNPIVFQE